MYYPPIFTPVRPFEPQPLVDTPIVGRENPLDLSTKTLRPSSDSGPEAEELIMLDHRKLANLAASHSLSRQLAPVDPALYRLAYGPEALAPFCYDRATGVAVPTSLATHQLMNSYIQQQQHHQQQAALLAARTSAQQAAFMDLATLPYGLRTAITQRETAAALAATRGLYAPAMPTPMVLPAFSLYTDDKGAFAPLRNGLGKCGSTCCSGLAPTVPCACCLQAPSQASLCATRSSIGCLKDHPTGAKPCDYLPFLHRPTVANPAPSDPRLSGPSYTTEIQPTATTTTWGSGLPGAGKTAFSVPKKKETKFSITTGAKITNGFYEKSNEVVVKKEVQRFEKDMVTSETMKREHDVKSLLTPVSSSRATIPHNHHHSYNHKVAQTSVTAVTPVAVSTRCEGSILPKTKLPPVLEPYRRVDPVYNINTGEYHCNPTTAASPHGPPPLIAAATKNHYQNSHDQKSPKKTAKPKVEEPSIAKPVPHVAYAPNWVPMTCPNVTIPPSKPPLPTVKKEPDTANHVLQSLLVQRQNRQPVMATGHQQSVIMSNPMLDYRHLARGLNLTAGSGSPAAGSTAPDSKLEEGECSRVAVEISRSSPKKRPNEIIDSDERKRLAKVEYAVVPGYPFQYPSFKAHEAKDVPLYPYAFVPESTGYCSSQMGVPKDVKPVLECIPSSVPLRVQVPESVKAPAQSIPIVDADVCDVPSSPLSSLVRLHLKNVGRGQVARARGRRIRRALARLCLADLKRGPRRVPQKRRIRIRSGLDMALKKHRKKKTTHVYRTKVVDSSLCIPAEMKKLMVNKALGETVLHRASRLGYPEVVAYCLETTSVNVNARDNACYTPLHECCSRGHLDIARALLRYGADVNASAAGGIRPLHDAVENDHVEVVRLLLSFGADPSIATYSGLTPIKLARSPLMAEFLQGFMADTSGELDMRPHLPWRFWGSASCLDPEPEENGFDILGGVPSDEESDPDGEGDDFLFEVSDSPHLPTFRLALPRTKTQCNYLRLSDVLRKVSMSRAYFFQHCPHIDVVSLPRHEFEASATCSQLLTGTKLDTLFASRMDDDAHTVELVKLDSNIRKVLAIETILVR